MFIFRARGLLQKCSCGFVYFDLECRRCSGGSYCGSLRMPYVSKDQRTKLHDLFNLPFPRLVCSSVGDENIARSLPVKSGKVGRPLWDSRAIQHPCGNPPVSTKGSERRLRILPRLPCWRNIGWLTREKWRSRIEQEFSPRHVTKRN
jgi:hypothetical protein